MLVSGASTRHKKQHTAGAEERAAIRKDVDKALLGPCNNPQKGGWNTHDNGRMVCRSLEPMTALGMMEDHNKLLPSTEYGSGPSNNAMRNRGVLILSCVLVALGSLLCFGKESPAKQPDRMPKPGGQATSRQPTSPQPANHGPVAAPNTNPPAPAAQTKPALQEPAPREPVRSPSSRPTEKRPDEQRPAERTAPAQDHAGQGERPAESPGQQKEPESPVQHSKPASPPGRESVHPKGKSSVGPSEQAPQRPEHVMVAGPEKSAGNGASKPVTPEKKSPADKSPAHAGPPANVSDSRSPGMGTEVPPDHKASTLAGHKTGSETTPGVNPSYRQAGTEGGDSGPRSVDLRTEEPAQVAEPSPANVPYHGVVRSSQTAVPLHVRDAVPAAPRGGKQSPAGEQVASGTPFGATKFLLDPLWDEISSLVDLTEAALRKASGSPKVYSSGTPHRGSLTQRGPPLEIPQPFSGFVQMMGGAALGSGASGNGAAPLLAVVVVCLVALLYQGWFRIVCAFLRPGTVYRPALERPG